jgi:hypothetical protein
MKHKHNDLIFMNGFGDAPIKGGGMQVSYGHPDGYVPKKPKISTTYIERRVPIELEDDVHKLIDDWLKQKGFDPRII